ncbi:MAG: hypothetical protein ABJA78_05550 [Ferruginibacter sp.]
MKTTPILLFAIVFSLASCKNYLAAKYKINQPFTFKTKHEYLDYLQQKKHFEKDKILYVDASTYSKLFNAISNGYAVYYGSFLNDSTEIKKSAQLMINEACMGRMDAEIKKNIPRQNGFDSLLTRSENIRQFKLLHAIDNSPLNINGNDGRLKVFMSFGFAQGAVYDELYKEVYKTYTDSNQSFDVYIMLIDPLYQMPD